MIRALLWLGAILGSAAGAVVLVISVPLAFGAPMAGASGGAIAAALAVVPYVAARAFDEIIRN